jgi:hypothetical protein
VHQYCSDKGIMERALHNENLQRCVT